MAEEIMKSSKSPVCGAPVEVPTVHGKPLSLKEIIRLMSTDGKFAAFIHQQLCLQRRAKKKSDRDAATAQLNSLFDPADTEIDKLHFAPHMVEMARTCTDQHKLLSAAAFAFAAEETEA